MRIKVGKVISVNGTKVTLKIDEESSKETLFYDGEKFKGVAIREYICIQRGFRDIVCLVEGEFLDESRIESDDGKLRYIRKVEAKPIGHFENMEFKQGIKYMPMIHDSAHLLKEKEIALIFGRYATSPFTIGRMLKEDIVIGLPWQKIFNSHIGIFGNTGSGKSNTLAKLYTTLFEQDYININGKSKFVILDFNGEYTGNQLVSSELKTTYQLSTRESTQTESIESSAVNKIPIGDDQFWDLDTLTLLFKATQNTQNPFLSRLINGRKKFSLNATSLCSYTKATLRRAFCAGEPKSATLDLMRTVAKITDNNDLKEFLSTVSWHSGQNKFFIPPCIFFDSDGDKYDNQLKSIVESMSTTQLDPFDQLVLRANLQLINDLVNGFVQFDHVQPLLKRIEASLVSLRKVLVIGQPLETPNKVLTVVSLKHCNSEIKKILPLLLAKNFYHEHKSSNTYPNTNTLHLIIDEAHNILSQQSSRENESWKDYRLELFEEIIKEGRKFGVFLTISSQRPADISPTIVSQIHNFFIHRLVNDRDLFLIDNTITTLDGMSRSMIPSLAQGCCVVTGTSFDLPMVLQIDPLDRAKQPDSEDIDLERLWAITPNESGD